MNLFALPTMLAPRGQHMTGIWLFLRITRFFDALAIMDS
jgi:hypothetical protein